MVLEMAFLSHKYKLGYYGARAPLIYIYSKENFKEGNIMMIESR